MYKARSKILQRACLRGLYIMKREVFLENSGGFYSFVEHWIMFQQVRSIFGLQCVLVKLNWCVLCVLLKRDDSVCHVTLTCFTSKLSEFFKLF